MRTALLLSAGLLGVAASWVVPSRVGAQPLPPGSWQQTCDLGNIDTSRGVMSARCGTGTDGPGEDINEDYEIEYHYNKDFQYSDCGGPIDNIFGDLRCPIDQAKVAARLKREADAAAAAASSAQAAAAAEAARQSKLELSDQIIAATPGLRAAAVIVLGRDLGNDSIRDLAMAARSPANPEARAAVLAREFDFAAASTFLKRYIARPAGEKYRNAAVDLAFLQVYGRLSTPGEQINYYNQISAGRAWYATIVNDLMPSIAPGSQIRVGVAQRVAQSALGRDPSLAELQQWTASGQNYGTMVEGARQQLWGGGDADPLILTVQRALNKMGRPSDDAGVKAAVAAWRPMKATYSEMIGPIGKAKLGNGRPPSPVRR